MWKDSAVILWAGVGEADSRADTQMQTGCCERAWGAPFHFLPSSQSGAAAPAPTSCAGQADPRISDSLVSTLFHLIAGQGPRQWAGGNSVPLFPALWSHEIPSLLPWVLFSQSRGWYHHRCRRANSPPQGKSQGWQFEHFNQTV